MNRMLACLAPAVIAASVTAASAGTCEPHWLSTFGEAPGTNGTVEAMASFDDGTGAALYVGGDFTRAGDVAVSGIATWDGESWSDVAGGMANNFGGITVRAFAVFDDGSGSGPALYVGGDFAIAGGADGVTVNGIAKWDGTSWSALGAPGSEGVSGFVWSLAVFDDGSGGGPALYVGGFFTMAGGISANRIAKWDGKTWSTLGSGMSGGAGGQVRALQVFDDGLGGGPALYAAGSFTDAGGVPVNRIAKWNASTSSWSALGDGMPTHIWDLEVFDDGLGGGPALYAAGEFTTAGGAPANRIAKWNAAASSWSALGTGMTGAGTVAVRSLVIFNNALHAAGNFTMAGNVAANSFAKWDPLASSWSPLGVGMNGVVTSLTIFDDGTGEAIFAGGSYIGLGLGLIVDRILKWDGTSWYPLGQGLTNAVRDLVAFDDGTGPALYASGNFITANGTPLLRIAKWEGGTSWSDLAGGVTSGTEVYALAGFDDGAGGGSALYAGGSFTVIGGNSISRVAKWDGNSWSALGVGTNNIVRALAVFDDGTGPALYVAGQFTMAGGASASRIAKWDGSSWSALGAGVNSTVTALTVFDDGTGEALYAAGGFTTAGGAPALRVAKWDGSSWSALGDGVSALASALTVYDDGSGDALYVGGGFTTAGGITVNHVAKWDGSSWSDVGGGTNGVDVLELAVFDDGSGEALYAGGEFTEAGGVPAVRIARWDGQSWSALDNGVDGPVGALTSFDDGSGDGPSLFVGGSFIASPAGDSYLAKWAGCANGPAIPGDITGDGMVDVNDLLAVVGAWGPCPAPPVNCPADIAPLPNGNGVVDVNDLLMVIANWD